MTEATYLWNAILGPYETPESIALLASQQGVCVQQVIRETIALARSQGFECDLDEAYSLLCVKANLPLQPCKLMWGKTPDRLALAAWGARAIWNESRYCERAPLPGPKPRTRKEREAAKRYEAFIDLVWDRMDKAGATEHQRILVAWLDTYGLPAMRALVIDESLHQDEDRVLTVEGYDCDGNHLRLIASPNRSFGYLYMCAMLLRVSKQCACTKPLDDPHSTACDACKVDAP